MNYFKDGPHILKKDLDELPDGSIVEINFEKSYNILAYVKNGNLYEARQEEKFIDSIDDGLIDELRFKDVEVVSVKDFSTGEDLYLPEIMFKHTDGKIKPFAHVSDDNEKVKVWMKANK